MKNIIIILTLICSFNSYANSDKEQKKAITLKVENVNNVVSAKVTGSNMVLHGIIAEDIKLKSGNHNLLIKWNNLADGDKKIALSENFESKPTVKKNLEKGDVVKAYGNPEVLKEAIERLKLSSEQNHRALSNNPSAAPMNGGSGYGTHNNPNAKQQQDFEPKFATKKKFGTTKEGCSIRYDLQALKAFVQEKITVNGVPEGDCKDSDFAYPLFEDFNAGCPVITEEDKTFKQFAYSFIDSTGNKVVATECAKSSDGLEHKYDNSECTIINHDEQLYSEVFARRYVESSGIKTYISSCEAIRSQPYALNNDGRYFLMHSSYEEINLNNAYQTPITHNNAVPTGWKTYNNIPAFSKQGDFWVYGKDQGYAEDKSVSFMQNNLSHYCYTGEAIAPWKTVLNEIIDHDYSDEIPTWSFISSPYQENITNPDGKSYLSWVSNSIGCTKPKCNIKKYNAYRSYIRADGSNYIIDNAVLDTKVICGNGSKLDPNKYVNINR